MYFGLTFVVTNYLDEKNIHYVTKVDNPACVPELRLIKDFSFPIVFIHVAFKDFWSILNGYVDENNWEAENEDQQKKNKQPFLFKKS